MRASDFINNELIIFSNYLVPIFLEHNIILFL